MCIHAAIPNRPSGIVACDLAASKARILAVPCAFRQARLLARLPSASFSLPCCAFLLLLSCPRDPLACQGPRVRTMGLGGFSPVRTVSTRQDCGVPRRICAALQHLSTLAAICRMCHAALARSYRSCVVVVSSAFFTCRARVSTCVNVCLRPSPGECVGVGALLPHARLYPPLVLRLHTKRLWCCVALCPHDIISVPPHGSTRKAPCGATASFPLRATLQAPLLLRPLTTYLPRPRFSRRRSRQARAVSAVTC